MAFRKAAFVPALLIASHPVSTWIFKIMLQKPSHGFCANPVGIYLLKVNNRNTRRRYEICSKLTINTPARRQWHHSGAFIVNFEDISRFFVDFEQLNVS